MITIYSSCNLNLENSGSALLNENKSLDGAYSYYDEMAVDIETAGTADPMSVFLKVYSYKDAPYKMFFDYQIVGGTSDQFMEYFYCPSVCESYDMNTLNTTCMSPSCIPIEDDGEQEAYVAAHRTFSLSYSYASAGEYMYYYAVLGAFDIQKLIELN